VDSLIQHLGSFAGENAGSFGSGDEYNKSVRQRSDQSREKQQLIAEIIGKL